MVFDDLKDIYPNLTKTANYLEENCYFYKSILTDLRLLGCDYAFGEEICSKALELNHGNQEQYFSKVHALIEFSVEFLRLQLDLEKTGHYLYSSFREVEEKVYADNSRKLSGPWYTWALYFSQFFWVIHNKAFSFFLTDFVGQAEDRGKVLEVPVGTGLFLTYFLKNRPNWQGTGVDIADSSISFSRDVFKIYKIQPSQLEIIKQDVYKYQPDKQFDRIMCGEFLEHLEDPLSVLKKLHSLLKPDGKLFVTVAVWAAMIDHIYLYKSTQEVRQQLKEAGFEIEKELVSNVFKKAGPEQEKTPINYCAILTKRHATTAVN